MRQLILALVLAAPLSIGCLPQATTQPTVKVHKVGSNTAALNKSADAKLAWAFGLGILAIAGAGAIYWWTESLVYAGGVAALGIGLMLAAIIGGWILDHETVIVVCLLGLPIVAMVIELFLNPTGGWESWLWSHIKTTTTTTTAVGPTGTVSTAVTGNVSTAAKS